MKLHLGCGGKIIKGFVNIDVRDLPGVDIVSDVETLKIFKNNSIDLIYASHILEHIPRVRYTSVLTRWYDLLKPQGILRIAVPDIEKVFQHYQINGDLRLLHGFLWGGQSNGFNYHYCGWDFKTLREDLLKIGFIDVEKYDWQKTEHSNIDDYSQSYLPHLDKENGLLMSLNIQCIKV